MLSHQRTALQSWVVIGLLLAVVLATEAYQSGDEPGSASGGEKIHVMTILGEGRRAIQAGAFPGAGVTAVLGQYELDLSKATVRPGDEVVVDVLSVMGGVTIRVPGGWTVDTRAVPMFGGVSDERVREFSASEDSGALLDRGPAPRLILRGAVVMGGLVITS